jgi:hypothetical protein
MATRGRKSTKKTDMTESAAAVESDSSGDEEDKKSDEVVKIQEPDSTVVMVKKPVGAEMMTRNEVMEWINERIKVHISARIAEAVNARVDDIIRDEVEERFQREWIDCEESWRSQVEATRHEILEVEQKHIDERYVNDSEYLRTLFMDWVQNGAGEVASLPPAGVPATVQQNGGLTTTPASIPKIPVGNPNVSSERTQGAAGEIIITSQPKKPSRLTKTELTSFHERRLEEVRAYLRELRTARMFPTVFEWSTIMEEDALTMLGFMFIGHKSLEHTWETDDPIDVLSEAITMLKTENVSANKANNTGGLNPEIQLGKIVGWKNWVGGSMTTIYEQLIGPIIRVVKDQKWQTVHETSQGTQALEIMNRLVRKWV